jgi:hypothetical protein
MNTTDLKEVLSSMVEKVLAHCEFLVYQEKINNEQLEESLKTIRICQDLVDGIYPSSELNSRTLLEILQVLEKNGYIGPF